MFLLSVIILFAAVTAALIRYLSRDYSVYFRNSAGRIENLKTEIDSVDKDYRVERFTMKASSGFLLNGYLKIPQSEKSNLQTKYPVFILLGGLFTGKNVINLISDVPDTEPVLAVSIDYPFDGEKQLNWRQILLALPRIRRAAMNSVRAVLLLIDLLESKEEADRERIYLGGISFGAFFGMAAAACDERIKAVASIFGGGKIRRLVAVNLPFKIPLLNSIIGFLTYLMVYPLEPEKYAESIAPRPFLVIGGIGDEKFPEECVRELYDRAKEPRDLIWFRSCHPEPTKNQLVEELTGTVVGWMKEKGLLKVAGNSNQV